MALNDALLPEFDREMGATRRVLALVPDAHLGWKPHEKSMTLGVLATHLAELPAWSPRIMEQTLFEIGPGGRGVLGARCDRPDGDVRASS